MKIQNLLFLSKSCALIVSAMSSIPITAQKPYCLDDLAFLEGHWRGGEEGGVSLTFKRAD